MSGENIPAGEKVEEVEDELQQIYQSLLKKSHEELAMEYANLLYVLDHAVPDLKEWILGIGRRIRLVKRDWNSIEGVLIGFEADIISLKLDVTELIKQWDKPVDKMEKKIVQIPSGSVTMWEWIEAEWEVPKEQQGGGS
jgi:hypothetical protein